MAGNIHPLTVVNYDCLQYLFRYLMGFLLLGHPCGKGAKIRAVFPRPPVEERMRAPSAPYDVLIKEVRIVNYIFMYP